MFAIVAQNAKLIALILGFAFATLGTLWAFTVTDNLSAEMQQLSDAKALTLAQADALNRIASEYFIANQQGDLIFITAQQNGANQEVARLIYRGNLLDRATPVRNMIGELAKQKQLDYRQTYDAYEKLNDETRANFTLSSFMQLKQVESEIIGMGQARAPALLGQGFEFDKAINAKQAEQSRNRVIGVFAALVGSTMLFAANLLAERNKSADTQTAELSNETKKP